MMNRQYRHAAGVLLFLILSFRCLCTDCAADDTAALKLTRGDNAVATVNVKEGQSVAEILSALGRPDYVDDDPWFSYKASPRGNYLLFFQEKVHGIDAEPDMASVTVWGVAGPDADAGEQVFLLPHRLRGKTCGDFIALRVRLDSERKKVATVALGMGRDDVLRLFHPARNLAEKQGCLLFPSIGGGKYLLVFSAQDDSTEDDSGTRRLSEVIYGFEGDEKPVYLLPFKKRGHAISAAHRDLLERDKSHRAPIQPPRGDRK